MEKSRMIKFPCHGDERGWLVVAEGGGDIPFEIKRIFYIFGSERDVVRGRHANINSEFVLINVAGSCRVRVLDGLGGEEIFSLDSPHTGVYIPRYTWKEMYDFSPDSILLCISSEKYDPYEYIRDYDEFADMMKGEQYDR